MSRATPEMRSLANDLISYETSRSVDPGDTTPAAFRAAERLRPHVVNMMGVDGYRALFFRALMESKVDVPRLMVRLKADGSLEWFEGSPPMLDAAEFLEGTSVVLAYLLGALVAFIGPIITSRLIGEIWPESHSIVWVSGAEEARYAKVR